MFIKNLTARQEGKTICIEFLADSKEKFHGHIGWALLRRDQLQIAAMTTHMQHREPFFFYNARRVYINISNVNVIEGTYFVYVGIFDKQAYKPLVIESVELTFMAEYDTLNSICHYDCTFTLE